MTNEQAKAQAKKRWGKAFYVRSGEHISSPERREKNTRTYTESQAEIESIETEIRRRLSELDWYQEMRSRQQKLRKQRDDAQSWALYKRFNVGRVTEAGFAHIMGDGDTWEEAFAKADTKG